MVKCDGKRKCVHRGLKDECGNAWAILQCEHAKVVEEDIWHKEDEHSSFRGNQGQTIEIPNLERIADVLEKIARELEKANKLKAATLRATIESDYLDEIMED